MTTEAGFTKVRTLGLEFAETTCQERSRGGVAFIATWAAKNPWLGLGSWPYATQVACRYCQREYTSQQFHLSWSATCAVDTHPSSLSTCGCFSGW